MDQISQTQTKEDSLAAMRSVILYVEPERIEDKGLGVMLDDVQGIVSRMISHARSAGRDYVDQCRLATDAVLAVRPDLSPQDVLLAIFRMRERDGLAVRSQTAG